MTERSAVSRYLTQLQAGLPAISGLRSRVLAEVADHLRDDIDARMGAGLPQLAAEQMALIAFGPPDLVARGVTESFARGNLRRAFGFGATLFVVVVVCSALVTSDFAHASAQWLADGPGTLFTWVVGQVALVAGTVSVIRAVAHRLNRAGTAQLYIVRGMLVVAISSALALVVDAMGVLTGAGHLGAARLLFVGAAGGASLTAVTAAVWSNRRVEACLRALNVSLAPETTIAQDMYCAAARLCDAAERRVPVIAPLLQAMARSAGRCLASLRQRAPWLPEVLNTRRHPMRFAILALAPLAALTLAYGIVQGLIAGSPASVAGPVMLGAFECSLAFMGYAALGRYLALR